MKKRTDDDGLTEEERKEVKAIQKETAKIKALASKTKDDTVDTTDRMVTLNEHTKEVGAGTMRNLQDQGGQAASFFFLVFVVCCLFILVVWFSLSSCSLPHIQSNSAGLRTMSDESRRILRRPITRHIVSSPSSALGGRRSVSKPVSPRFSWKESRKRKSAWHGHRNHSFNLKSHQDAGGSS